VGLFLWFGEGVALTFLGIILMILGFLEAIFPQNKGDKG